MSATVRFYTGFVIVLGLIIAAAFYAGAKSAHARPAGAPGPSTIAYRECVRAVKATVGSAPDSADARPPAYGKFLALLLGANGCARKHALPYLSESDVYDATGVRVAPGGAASPNDPIWQHPDATRAPRSDDASGLR